MLVLLFGFGGCLLLEFGEFGFDRRMLVLLLLKCLLEGGDLLLKRGNLFLQ